MVEYAFGCKQGSYRALDELRKPREGEMVLMPAPESYKFCNQLYHKSNSPYSGHAK